MTANVFGERFAGRNTPAWHKLGTVFTTPITASDALKLAGLNFNVVKSPIYSNVPSPLPGWPEAAINVELDNHFAIIREPTSDDQLFRCFGIVSNQYEVIQNAQIAEYLDTLVGTWPVETAGALGYGETIFFSLDAGLTSIGGEEIHQYFLATDTKDGKTAMRLAFTPVRVVCQNTLTAGTASATVLQWLEHTSDVQNQFAYRIKLLSNLQAIQGTTMANFQKMAEAILSAEAAREVFTQAYPMPKRPGKASLLDELTKKDTDGFGTLYEEMTSAQAQWVAACERCATLRVDAGTMLETMNDQNGALANTAWYVYNAVTDNEDHRDGPDTMFASALWGDRAQAKVRAYQNAMAIITK